MTNHSAVLGDEKMGIKHIDDNAAYQVDSHTLADDYGFTPAEQKAIIRRIDRRLITTLGVMYCVSLMDRTNLGAANIAGMATELVLIDERYVSVNKCVRVYMPRYMLTAHSTTVDRLPRLLRHIHCFSASINNHRPRRRTQAPPGPYHHFLGGKHDRYGVRQGLGAAGRFACVVGYPRSWLLPQLCIPAQHVVHQM